MLSFNPVDQRVFDYYPRLGRVQQYVGKHYAEEISLTKAANVAAMEATYFSTYFRKKVGIGFSEWLRQFRIQKAIKLMMEENDHSITNIAFAVGFNDLRTFGRSFKKYTATRPADFRKSLHS